ncbi:B12-binding domain-containing radical SAM protein [Streptomyces sp. NBC_01716]|uniref:B12-binding domain-containing radical SAM protein n=1 Tax=Streptomyces sp. NBC_01716 TaxID=2975917 RepID=UPI002E37F790|nr:radical SAM protein [Streptomyces sp. NBC_01716]
MKILVLWPPQVPSYFNAGHHLTVFNVASHLRTVFPSASVRAVDAAALNVTWKALGDLLMEQHDVVALANDFDSIDSLHRTVRYTRELAPRANIVTFGRLSSQLPEFFQRFDLDAVVGAGDPETGVEDFVRAAADEAHTAASVWSRVAGQWRAPVAPPRLLSADELPLPDVTEIPYGAYEQMYADDTARFCGIPQRRELVVPVARGCPVGCDFCDIPGREGRTERRQPIDRLIEFIESATRELDFEYVSMYAPTFTLRRAWSFDFCDAYEKSAIGLPWKCTTTLHHLSDELVGRMGETGCVRISVGLETLESSGHAALPRAKHIEQERFRTTAEACEKAGVELNCFVILGLPGTSTEGVENTIKAVREVNGRVRPTIYTDFGRMSAAMDEASIASFNRQLFQPDQCPPDAEHYYRVLFDPLAPITPVSEKIPRRTPK